MSYFSSSVNEATPVWIQKVDALVELTRKPTVPSGLFSFSSFFFNMMPPGLSPDRHFSET